MQIYGYYLLVWLKNLSSLNFSWVAIDILETPHMSQVFPSSLEKYVSPPVAKIVVKKLVELQNSLPSNNWYCSQETYHKSPPKVKHSLTAHQEMESKSIPGECVK